MVGKAILYFVFAVFIYMGADSCTKSMLPRDSAQMVATFLAVIAFVVAVVLGFILGKKDKDKVKK